MTLPGSDESYWIASSETTAYPQLDADVDVDVAVVGAGIAGISTAWELTRAGLRVALVDSSRIAMGVTGHTTAKLSSLHNLVYAHIKKSFGADAARMYAESQQGAVEHACAVAAELGIDCDIERVPGFTYVEGQEGVGDIRAEVDAASEAGLEASLVTETGLPFPVAAAVRVEAQAQFHPRKYLLALASDLARRGGLIFENTRIVSLDEGAPCRVLTASGNTITANDVVIATHYPVFNRVRLFTRLAPHRDVVVAGLVPVDSDPGGIYISPENNVRSVRTAPYDDDHRLLIVTGEAFRPGAGHVSERFERLAAWTSSRFPGVGITYRWAAQDNRTTDRIPYIGRFHPGSERIYVATGFGGWGMSSGVLSGRLLSGLVTGDPPSWAGLYDPRRLHAAAEARPFVAQQAEVTFHFVGDRVRPSEVDSPDLILPGTGAIVRAGAARHAVFRDDNGELHTLSARCTHLGCIVHFNDAERTWECPCHGSRFAIDGSVIQGPANRPLPPVHHSH